MFSQFDPASFASYRDRERAFADTIEKNAQILRQAMRADETPFDALKRLRADRYGHLVASPWRHAGSAEMPQRVKDLKDATCVKFFADRLRSLNRPEHADADALAFARELEHLSAVLHTILHPALTSFEHLPMVPDAPKPGQTNYSWPELDGLIFTPDHSYNTTPPMPSIKRTKNSSSIIPYVGAYGWDTGEMEAALLGNVPLPTLSAWFALYSIQKDINQHNYFGSTALGVPGYFTASGVVSTPVANGTGGKKDWLTKSTEATGGAEILADIATMYQEFMSAIVGGELVAPMNGVSLAPQKLFMPVLEYSILRSTRYSALNPTMLIKLVEEQMGLECVVVPEMAGAFAGGQDNDNAVGIARVDPMIAGRVVAKPFTELPPQFRDFNVRVNCSTEAGGCATFKPIGLRLYTF